MPVVGLMSLTVRCSGLHCVAYLIILYKQSFGCGGTALTGSAKLRAVFPAKVVSQGCDGSVRTPSAGVFEAVV